MSGAVASKDFVVLSAGLAYRSPGVQQDEVAECSARVGRVIALDEAEAARLTALDAIRPATDADREQDKILAELEADARAPAEAPKRNPWGGRVLRRPA